MARGGDFYFAELVTQLRVKHPEVTLEAVIPYREQSRHWEPADRRRYLALVKSCNAVTILQEDYTPQCMQRRNQYMVDRSRLVIALYSGAAGGASSGWRPPPSCR